MTSARASKLATLRRTIGSLERPTDELARVALGHAEADAILQGGLVRGAVHEVFAEGSRHVASATGFVAGLAHRVSQSRPVVWVAQDFTEIESGTLWMSGFAELGLDPRKIVTIRAADAEIALRVAVDAIACDALGAVVLDVWGDVRHLDLVVSRKLTLAARTSNVTTLLLRASSTPSPSTAETRWIVRAAHSPQRTEIFGENAWGMPMLETRLVRNRHGSTGQWIMEWNRDECIFRENAPHPQPVASAPANRQIKTQHLRAG